jgi:DNA-directed RNA polymerase subunit RPC12/RpoP
MGARKTGDMTSGRSFDSAYGFSFAIGIGLILFIAGLVISLTLGEGTVVGLIFGIPLLIAGLVLPLVMMRGLFTQNEVSGVCPYCSAPIKTSDATIRLRCMSCNHEIVVRDLKLYRAEEVTLS